MSDTAPRVTIEELLAHASWVEALAQRLVRDPGTAQDVVQQTWLAGMLAPPSDRARIRGWLGRVVRNFATEAHRTAVSRHERARRAARDEALPSTESLLERAEVSRRLAEEVTQLDEPYRTAILLRYWQGLPARTIAKRQGLPLDTVRTRIRRGVEMLRGRLRARDGDGWTLALLPLAHGGAGLGVPESAPRIATRIRTSNAATAGIAAALLVGVGWWLLRPDAPRELSTDVTAGAVTKALERTAARSSGAAVSTRPKPPDLTPALKPTDTMATTPSPPATARVLVTLHATAGESPVPIRVLARPLGIGWAPSRAATRPFEMGAGGGAIELPRALPDGAATTEWELRVEHPDLVPAQVRVNLSPAAAQGSALAVASCELPLVRAGILLGTANPPRPVEESAPHAAAFSSEDGADEAVDEVAATPAGEFRLRLRPGVAHRIVVAARDASPVVLDMTVPGGETRRADPIVLDAGRAVAGTVEGFDGLPAAHTIVFIEGTDLGRTLAFGPYVVTLGAATGGTAASGAATDVATAAAAPIDWSLLRTTTDDAGRFRVGGLGTGTYRVRVAPPGVTPDLADALAQAITPPAENLRFRTSAGAIVLSVTRAATPLVAAPVSVLAGGRSTVVKTDREGRATIYGVAGTTYECSVRAKGIAPRKLAVAAPPAGEIRYESLDVDDASRGARLTISLRADSGELPTHAGVALFDENSAAPRVLRDVTGTAGVFVVEGLPVGHWRVGVRPGGTWSDPHAYLAEETVDVDLRDGAEARVERTPRPAGRLALAARTPDGRYLPARCVLIAPDGAEIHVSCPRRDAWSCIETRDALSPAGLTDVFPTLPSGTYGVRCDADGYEMRQPTNVVVRAGKTTECLIELVPR